MPAFEPALLRRWNRLSLADGALGKPDRIAGRLNSGGCLEPILEHRNARLISVNGNGRDDAAAVFGHEELAIRCAHAIRPLDRLVHPDVNRCPRLSGGVYRDSVKFV